MKKEDYQVFLELVNSASFKGDKSEYVSELKQRIVKEIETTEKGSE